MTISLATFDDPRVPHEVSCRHVDSGGKSGPALAELAATEWPALQVTANCRLPDACRGGDSNDDTTYWGPLNKHDRKQDLAQLAREVLDTPASR